MPNQGYNHIALFTPLNASKPRWITAGEWEVTEISGFDTEKGLVYVLSLTFSPLPLPVIRINHVDNPLAIQLLYRRNPFYRQTHLLDPLTHFRVQRR